jgi:hypothetical protein
MPGRILPQPLWFRGYGKVSPAKNSFWLTLGQRNFGSIRCCGKDRLPRKEGYLLQFDKSMFDAVLWGSVASVVHTQTFEHIRTVSSSDKFRYLGAGFPMMYPAKTWCLECLLTFEYSQNSHSPSFVNSSSSIGKKQS